MQLGRCCKCNSNPLTACMYRHLRAVGPLPPELGYDTGLYGWGTFTLRRPVQQYGELEKYANRVGYYLTIPPTAVPLAGVIYVTAQPFRYALHSWGEGFYGSLQRQDSPDFFPGYTTVASRHPQPFNHIRALSSMGSGLLPDAADVSPFQVVPPTNKFLDSQANHILSFQSEGLAFSPFYNNWLAAGLSFPQLGQVYINIKGVQQLQATIQNGMTKGRVWVNGVDVTGVVDLTSPPFGGTGWTGVPVNLSSVRDAEVWLDLWHTATIKLAAGGGGPIDQIGYIGSWPGENIVSIGKHNLTNSFQGLRLTTSGNTVGGSTEFVVGVSGFGPSGYYQNTGRSETFGNPGFSSLTYNQGEGFLLTANAEIPCIRVVKPIPGAVNGSLAKRVVWYMPQNNDKYDPVVMPNGVSHKPGLWSQNAPTTFVPYGYGFRYQQSLNSSPTQWLDFKSSGDTPPQWSPGDAVYSDFPTSILVSPP